MQHTQHDMDVISACVSAGRTRGMPSPCGISTRFAGEHLAMERVLQCRRFYADALLGNGLTERAGKMYAYYGYPQHARVYA